MAVPRPTIAVTGPDRGGFVAWIFTRRAVRAAGGRAIRIRPKRPRHDVVFDGLIIGGGADVDPRAYGEDPVAKPEVERLSHALGWLRAVAGFVLAPIIYVLRWLFSRKIPMGTDVSRDALELALLDRAVQANLPVLGICRGAQLINVRQGGTLHRDLATFYDERQALWTVLPRKYIRIDAGTILSTTLQSSSSWVNSLHRQAVADLGDDLRVSARDEGGVVQAVEHIGRRFCIGVQWHPEYMPQQEDQRRLFQALVREAAQVRHKSVHDSPSPSHLLPDEKLRSDLPMMEERGQRVQ